MSRGFYHLVASISISEKCNFKPNFDPLYVICLLFLVALNLFLDFGGFFFFLKSVQICIFHLKMQIFLQLWKLTSHDFSKYLLSLELPRVTCGSRSGDIGLLGSLTQTPSSLFIYGQSIIQQLDSEVNDVLYSSEILFSSFLKMKYSMFLAL